MSKKANMAPRAFSASGHSRNDLVQHFKQSFATSKTSSMLEKKRKISDLIIDQNVDEDDQQQQLFAKTAKLDMPPAETSQTKEDDDESSLFDIDDVLEDCGGSEPSPSVVNRPKPTRSVQIQKSPVSSYETVKSHDQLSFIEKILEGIDEDEDDGCHSPVIVQGKLPNRLALDLSTFISSQLDDQDDDEGLSQANESSKAIESPNLTQNVEVDNPVEHSRIIDDSYLDEMATGQRTKYNVDELLDNEYRMYTAKKTHRTSLLDELLRQEHQDDSLTKEQTTSRKTTQSDQAESEVLSQSIEILSLKDSNQSQQQQIRDEFDDDSYLDEGERLDLTIEDDDTLEPESAGTVGKPASEWLKDASSRKKLDESSNPEGKGDKVSLMTKSDALNEILGKKRTKYVKNGFAEQLHKLLIRQASSVNFIRHNIDKYKQDMETMSSTQELSSSGNVITCAPFYKQASVVLKFTLVHALVISKDQRAQGKCIYLFFSHDYEWLNDESKLRGLCLKIYPPWKKVFLKSHNKEVFFCTNLIEMSLSSQETRTLSASIRHEALFSLKAITCNRCPGSQDSQQVECDFNLFQVSKILQKSKSSLIKSDPDQDLSRAGDPKELSPSQQVKVKQTVRVPDFILYTQSDAEYYLKAALTQGSSSSTQYMRENSILDAIENSGYLGLVSFKATVQRCSVIQSAGRSWQPTQSQTGSTLRRQAIVTDKCGVFAVILFPLSTRVFESQKCRFCSLKLVEKLDLYQKENEAVNLQIEFLWDKMNNRGSATHAKTYPKVINSFEYQETSSFSSFLEPQGISKNYIALPTFYTTKALVDTLDGLDGSKDRFLTNLGDVILLKLVESFEAAWTLYYLIASTDEDNFRVCHISLESLAHLESPELAGLLEANHICLGRYLGGLTSPQDQQQIICIKNLCADNLKRISATSFTFVSMSQPDPTSPDSQLIDSIDFNKMNALRSTFKYMDRQRRILQHDFIQISVLNIVDVCLEASSLTFPCQNRDCQGGLKPHLETSEWACQVCELRVQKPEISLSLSVLIDCKGPTRIKYLKLHRETVTSLIPTDSLRRKLDKLSSARKDQEPAGIQEVLDVTWFVNKQLGPIFAFVSEIDDAEIRLEELQPL